MAETPRPIYVTVDAHERETHQWMTRSGNIFLFKLFEVFVNGRRSMHVAVLVADSDVEEK